MPEPITIPEKKIGFSWRFYVGTILIFLSVIMGTITKILFFLYIYDSFQMWLWGILYLLTWPMLVLGVWWVGKEYYNKIKKYTEYRFYHESMKSKSKELVSKARDTTWKIGTRALAHTTKVKAGVKSKLGKLKVSQRGRD